jgi:hypothetical protein
MSANVKQGGGLGAKIPKPSSLGSVLCVPLEILVGGDGGMWWVGLCGAITVMGWRIRKREAGRGLRAKIPKLTTVAQFRDSSGCRWWAGVLWGYTTPCQCYLRGQGHGSELIYLYGGSITHFGPTSLPKPLYLFLLHSNILSLLLLPS